MPLKITAAWTLTVLVASLGGCTGPSAPATSTAMAPSGATYEVQAIRDRALHRKCIAFCRRIDAPYRGRCVRLCERTFRGCAPGAIGEPGPGDTGPGDSGPGDADTGEPTETPPDGTVSSPIPTPVGSEPGDTENNAPDSTGPVVH